MEAPQRIGVQPDAESIMDKVEEMQQAEHEFRERDTEGAEEPAVAPCRIAKRHSYGDQNELRTFMALNENCGCVTHYNAYIREAGSV